LDEKGDFHPFIQFAKDRGKDLKPAYNTGFSGDDGGTGNLVLSHQATGGYVFIAVVFPERLLYGFIYDGTHNIFLKLVQRV